MLAAQATPPFVMASLYKVKCLTTTKKIFLRKKCEIPCLIITICIGGEKPNGKQRDNKESNL